MLLVRKLIVGLIVVFGLLDRTIEAATFEAATDGLLDRVTAILDKEGRRALFFDSVSVPIQGTDTGLRKEIADRLRSRAGLKTLLVDNRLKADTYLDVTLEKDTEGTQAILRARLRNPNDNKELTAITSDAIDNVSDLTRLLNLTVNQRVEGDTKPSEGLSTTESVKAAEQVASAKQDLLKQAFTRSIVKVSEDSFKASTDNASPYQIEVRTRDQDGKYTVKQPIKIIKDATGNQFAFVDLPIKTVFAIRVVNAQSDHDVGVRVLLDGINSLELCEDAEFKQQGCWYVRKQEAGMVKGWLVNESLIRSFETSSLADGLITSLKQTDLSNVGTITVSFFPAWTGNGSPPIVERAGVSKAITQGPAITNKVDVVNDVHFGKTLLSSITIRYERPTTERAADTAQAKR